MLSEQRNILMLYLLLIYFADRTYESLRILCPMKGHKKRKQMTEGRLELGEVHVFYGIHNWYSLWFIQLHALASELKTGFTEAMQELSRIQHGEYALEEKVQSCRCAMEEKVAEMKNSLNCFKVGHMCW